MLYRVLLIITILLTFSGMITAQTSACSDFTELKVGGYAEVIETDGLQLFSGQPYPDYDNNSLEIVDDGWYPQIGDTLLVVEGPFCNEAGSLWRLQPNIDTSTSHSENIDRYSGENLWIHEIIDDIRLLQATGTPTIPRIILKPQDAAPVVDAELQLSYFPGGAGGIEKPPCLETFRDWQTAVYIGAEFLSDGICMELGFTIAAGDVARFTHNGRVYFQENLTDDQRYLNLPQYETQPIGLWIVEIKTADQIHQIAYEVDRLTYAEIPEVIAVCDDYYPSLYFTQYLPGEEAQIAMIDEVEQHANSGLVASAKPEFIWNMTMGDDGKAFVSLGYLQNPPKNFISIQTRDIGMINNTWFHETDSGDYILEVLGDRLDPIELGFKQLPFACILPLNNDDILNLPIQADRLVMGNIGGDAPDPIRFAYEGTANTLLTITVTAVDEAFDPIVRFYDADETLLAENDDAEQPEFGALDSQIVDFSVSETATYIVEVSRVTVDSGEFMLLIGESK